MASFMKSKIITIGYLLLSLNIATGQDKSIELLKKNQYDLSNSGMEFLLNEARKNSFFLIGELHGDKQIPQLLFSLWPEMNSFGYNHIAAELSPWAAGKLESGTGADTLKTGSLWSKAEARFVHAKNASAIYPTIWGCDMQETGLELLIKDLGQADPQDTIIARLSEKVKNGYSRKMVPGLLDIIKNFKPG
jgi:hypothetical protein